MVRYLHKIRREVMSLVNVPDLMLLVELDKISSLQEETK